MVRHYWPNAVMIRGLALKNGITSAQQLQELTGLSNKPVLNAWGAKKRCRVSTLQAIAETLGIGDEIDLLIDWSRTLDRQTSAETAESPLSADEPPIFDPAMKPQQDIKVAVNDAGVRERLLTGRNLPSFWEAFDATAMVTTVDDAHKDHPLFPGATYNHFLQPSVVVTLNWKNQSVPLACHRTTAPSLPYNVHTTGLAILFAADPCHHLKNGCFTEWLSFARRKPKEAASSLLRGSQAILSEILKKTIDLRMHKPSLEPLCVITNDQRDGKNNRVYTQFVFRATVAVADGNVDRFIGNFQTKRPLQFCRLAESCDPLQAFVSASGRPNLMDQLAWSVLHSSGPVEPLNGGKAWCSRGFSIA
ncbi:MAG: hypothetical protein JNK76_24580 [Planctomycetales bacterium]|nr:hypothetical protein [Planctomycetales bacterium]MBN8625046.1 hypothetical protein [Planctomycetota bacterium]